MPDELYSGFIQWYGFLAEYRLPMFGLSSHPLWSGQLMYFVSSVVDEMRLTPLLNTVIETAKADIERQSSVVEFMLVIVCVCQALVLVALIAFLAGVGARIEHVMSLLLFLSPEVVLHNVTIAHVIAHGRLPRDHEDTSFQHAEAVVEVIRDAAILVDRFLVIKDCNQAASQLLGLQKASLLGRALSDVLVAPSGEMALGRAFTGIAETLDGAENSAAPDETVRIEINGATKIVTMKIHYLTELGVLKTREPAANIVGVVIQILDMTEQKRQEEEVEREVSQVRSILENVIPAPIVKQLAGGTESTSFAVQSSSVGCIRLKIAKEHINLEDPFRSVHKVYDLLNEWMVPFPQLTRLSVVANEYLFAGGVFTMTNKPEKHAEEATRYALKVLSSVSDIAVAVGHDITLLIGLATGGPLTGGIMGSQRPQFELVGSTVKLAQAVAESAPIGQIQVTRSVYELVYSHNFKVTERGDIKLSGGESVHTYVIST
jgi:PAS domain S-box-containing protein